jgi:hypothetical protein
MQNPVKDSERGKSARTTTQETPLLNPFAELKTLNIDFGKNKVEKIN